MKDVNIQSIDDNHINNYNDIKYYENGNIPSKIEDLNERTDDLSIDNNDSLERQHESLVNPRSVVDQLEVININTNNSIEDVEHKIKNNIHKYDKRVLNYMASNKVASIKNREGACLYKL